MILIMARTQQDAFTCARARKLHPKLWRYVRDPEQMKAYNFGTKLWLVEGYAMRENAEEMLRCAHWRDFHCIETPLYPTQPEKKKNVQLSVGAGNQARRKGDGVQDLFGAGKP